MAPKHKPKPKPKPTQNLVVLDDQGQEATVSERQLVELQKNLVNVRANYCERSTSSVIQVDPNDTVEDVLALAKNAVHRQMKEEYKLDFVIDDSITDIQPEPKSRMQKWKEVNKDTVIIFWPEGEYPHDSVLRAKHKSILEESVLHGEEISELKKKVDEQTAMIKSLLARADSQEEKSAKSAITDQKVIVLETKIEALLEKLTRLENKLSGVETELDRAQTELSRLITNNKWLYYRYLLDNVRAQVAKEKGIPSWHDIDKADRLTFATEALTQLKERSPIKDKFEVTPADLASFLTDKSAWIRQQGNLIAQSGGQKDIAEAVLSSEGDRKLLIATYMMFFEEDPELSLS